MIHAKLLDAAAHELLILLFTIEAIRFGYYACCRALRAYCIGRHICTSFLFQLGTKFVQSLRLSEQVLPPGLQIIVRSIGVPDLLSTYAPLTSFASFRQIVGQMLSSKRSASLNFSRLHENLEAVRVCTRLTALSPRKLRLLTSRLAGMGKTSTPHF